MEENHQLRGLVRGLSQFIGEGSGGLVSKLGWSMEEFTNFVARGETDTAYESYQRRKKMRGVGGASGSQSTTGQKRAAEELSVIGANKRSRDSAQHSDVNTNNTGYPPMPSPQAGAMYPGTTRSPHDASLFSDLMRGSGGSAMFMPPNSVSAPVPNYPPSGSTAPPGHPVYQPAYIPPAAGNSVEQPLAPLPFSSNGTGVMADPHITQEQEHPGLDQDFDEDPKKTEAYRLIQ